MDNKGKGRYAGGLDLGYKAKWPSASAHARHYRFFVIDILLCAYSCLVMRAWGFGRLFNPLFMLPWTVRVLHRALHAALSFPVLPSPVIYYRGAFKDFIPELLRKVQVGGRA